MSSPRVALAPDGVRSWLADAIESGGGTIVASKDAEALVWAEPAKGDELDALVARRGPHREVGAAAVGRDRAVRPRDP